MNEHQWQKVKELLENHYPKAVWDSQKVEIDQDARGLPVTASVESAEFDSDLGRVRLEYWQKPLLLETRPTASRRAGSQYSEVKIYSPDEFTTSLKALSWDAELNDWKELRSASFLDASF